MKTLKHFTTVLLTLITINITAQQGINYKALIKDGGGNVVANQAITIQFQILKGVGMTNVYQETHTPNTDANGMVILNIGEGAVDSGIYVDIDWGSDDHYLNVQIDTGVGLTDMGTTQFMTVPYALQSTKAANVTGLEALDEGNGIGWRLIGRNPALHGNIGLNGVDLSYSPFSSSTRGATGDRSFATGYRTTASGILATALGNNSVASGDNSTATGVLTTASGAGSTAMGYDTTASNAYSTAMGFQTVSSSVASTSFGNLTSASGAHSTAMGNYTSAIGSGSTAMGSDSSAIGYHSTAIGSGTIASGERSTAIGFMNEASGIYSTAMGAFTTASGNTSTTMGNNTTSSGDYSIAMGLGTTASGLRSMAMGLATKAESTTSVAIGAYNIGGGNASSWVSTDPLFEIGNGAAGSPNNALTVFKNGNVNVGGNMYVQSVLVHSSDLRLKQDITNLNYGLDEVLQLRPVTYNWKSNPHAELQVLGLIAQEVQPVIGELVGINEHRDDTLTLNYEGLIPVLINAIQEQQELIEKQNKNYENLLKRVEQLENSHNQ